MSAHDDDKFDGFDDPPTAIDPGVPTGARDRPARFDPHARLADNRAKAPPRGRPVAAEVIAALPPVRHDDPVTPRVRAPSNFDPHARIDDSSRTAKWAPNEVGTEAPTVVEGLNRGDNPARRAKAPGQDAAARPVPRAPTAPPQGPVQVPRDRSEPMRVISMKTPTDVDFAEKERAPRVLPVVNLRAMQQAPPRGMGNLAAPYDPREARSRRLRDNVIWGSLALILASIVTLAIWFLAQR